MIFLAEPSAKTINDFLARQRDLPFSYPEVGHSSGAFPSRYTSTSYRLRLGEGKETFEAAKKALACWKMFNLDWIRLCWPATPIETGSVIGILAIVPGVWWLNACRIVYVVNEDNPARKFSFAYGTLPDHIARGEERFTVEWLDDNSVWYDLSAFSRPAHWLARVARPLARRRQRRFAAESLAAMEREVRRALAQ